MFAPSLNNLVSLAIMPMQNTSGMPQDGDERLLLKVDDSPGLLYIKSTHHIRGLADWQVLAGRGGSCELMIGCIAQAKSNTLHMDDTEMEEVRWVSRADVAKALDRSSSKDNPLTGDTPKNHAQSSSAARHTAVAQLCLISPVRGYVRHHASFHLSGEMSHLPAAFKSLAWTESVAHMSLM